jgi:hypothetical protein
VAAAAHADGQRFATQQAALLGGRLSQVTLVWGIFGVVLVAALVTYGRLPAGAMYHFTDSGLSGAVSRSIAYLVFPVAIAAIGVAWAVCATRTAALITLLCGVAFLPGVISSSDLTARWADVPPVVGVVITVVATLRASDAEDRPIGRVRWVLLGLILLCSVPWLIAAVGLYAEDLPPLGRILMSRDPTPGHHSLAAVHLGLHDGLFGAQLAATGIILSARRLNRALALYLSLMIVYGLMLAVQDGWSEQVVKRGWSHTDLPGSMQPSISIPWAVILAASFALHMVLTRLGPKQ